MNLYKQIKLKQFRDMVKAYANSKGITFGEAHKYFMNTPNPWIIMVKKENVITEGKKKK